MGNDLDNAETGDGSTAETGHHGDPYDTTGADAAAGGYGDAVGGGYSDAATVTGADELLNECMVAYSNGDYAEAIRKGHQVINGGADPIMVARARYGVVMCYDQLGDFANAAREMATFVSMSEVASSPNIQGYLQQRDSYNSWQHWPNPMPL